MKTLSILSVLLCAACLEAAAQGTTMRFAGKVTDMSGKGIPGVVVNDGRHFVKTDRQGSWSLETDTVVSKFVCISTPANYRLPQREGLSDGFYVSVGKLAAAKGQHDFVLEKRKETSDDFYYLNSAT